MNERLQPRRLPPVIALTGGGTGGHVYPALAVLERLSTSIAERAIWVGSRRGVERSIVERHGIRYHAIATGKLRRYFSLRNAVDPFLVVAGFFQARRILRRSGVTRLFSKGGFVAVPVVVAAWTLRIPVALHESDVVPGLATRLTAPFASRLFLAHAATTMPPRARSRATVVGNPIRRAMVSGRTGTADTLLAAWDRDVPLLLVLGGSLGARQINHLVWDVLEQLCEDAFVVHQTGRNDVLSEGISGSRYVHRQSFGDELGDLYANADVVVSRAGAGSLAEIAANRIPAVLLPLSRRVSRGDQVDNARVFERSGAAVVLDPDKVDAAGFARSVVAILRDSSRRDRMRSAYATMPANDAAERIAAWLRS